MYISASGLTLVIVLAVSQVHCQPVREERSLWDFITNLSTVPRIVSDVLDEDSPPPSASTQPPVEERIATYSPLEDFITNLSTVPRIVSDVLEGDSPPPSASTEPPVEERIATYSPLEDIIFRITRFKRSTRPVLTSAYSCGGWGKPLPIPPPCRRY